MCIAQQKQGLVLRPIPQEIGKVTILGNASLEVTYAFNATDLTDEQTYIDLQVLRAGRSVSKYYSRFLELDDSLCSDFKRKNSSASSIPELFCQQGRNSNYWSEYQFTEIFSQNGTRTYYVRMPFAMQRYNCYYMEPIEQQRWQLDNDTCRILGYRCQKAHCFGVDVSSRHGLPQISQQVKAHGTLEDFQVLFFVSMMKNGFTVGRR